MELDIKFIEQFLLKNKNYNVQYFFENCFTNAKLILTSWCNNNYYRECTHEESEQSKLGSYYLYENKKTYFISIVDHIEQLIKIPSSYPLEYIDYRSVICDKCDKSLCNICDAHSEQNDKKCICDNVYYTYNKVIKIEYLCDKDQSYYRYTNYKNINLLQNEKDYNQICFDKINMCFKCDSLQNLNYYFIYTDTYDSYDLCEQCYNETPCHIYSNMKYIKPVINQQYKYYANDDSIQQFNYDCSLYYQFKYEYDNKEIIVHYLSSCCSAFDLLFSENVTIDDIIHMVEVCQNKNNDLTYVKLYNTCFNKQI
jgi:hypothetical protein